jgi:hypothetical protein
VKTTEKLRNKLYHSYHAKLLGRLRLKCDGTRAETRFRLSAKRTSPFKSAGASVQSTTGSRAVRISLQGLYCSCKPVFCSHVTLTGYPLHYIVSPSFLRPCVTVCHHISAGLYNTATFVMYVMRTRGRTSHSVSSACISHIHKASSKGQLTTVLNFQPSPAFIVRAIQ